MRQKFQDINENLPVGKNKGVTTICIKPTKKYQKGISTINEKPNTATRTNASK